MCPKKWLAAWIAKNPQAPNTDFYALVWILIQCLEPDPSSLIWIYLLRISGCELGPFAFSWSVSSRSNLDLRALVWNRRFWCYLLGSSLDDFCGIRNYIVEHWQFCSNPESDPLKCGFFSQWYCNLKWSVLIWNQNSLALILNGMLWSGSSWSILKSPALI